jgi:hypothetical protein
MLVALLVYRELWPARLVVWTGICEWTGFLLVAGLAAWLRRQLRPAVAGPRPVEDSPAFPSRWFSWAQACLSAVCTGLILWILLDPAFDALGHGTALFGLAGRLTSCPAALMLLGATILMAWQSDGRWRAAWQYASLGIAVLFTSSVGWARLDPAGDAVWLARVKYLFVSASMMTVLTSVGLARVLPHSGDWLVRARRATPVFGGLALVLATVLLVGWLAS